jgi:uncharacterized protein (TIGR02117 family)
MVKWFKRILKWGFILVIGIPLLFLVISYILTKVTVNDAPQTSLDQEHYIYLNTSGIHLDIIIPQKMVSQELLADIVYLKNEDYLSFGWGEEKFYLETPTWADLTVYNACQALLWKSSSLMHITRHQKVNPNWAKIAVNQDQLDQLNNFILGTFALDQKGRKHLLEEAGYTSFDNFYKANGDYHCFNTCNSWVNEGFKVSGLKACFWTPFDFGLMELHTED